MTSAIATLRAAGVLAPLDAEFARTLGKLAGETDDAVLLGAALASRATREGHVCADLSRLSGTVLADERGASIGGVTLPELPDWQASLRKSRLVGDGSVAAPLVLDARGRLYLSRYFQDEQDLARALRERSGSGIAPADGPELAALLRRLFGPSARDDDMQFLGAALSAVSRLTVVTGGPGTGKTTTVAKILALALSDALARGRKRPRALLLAPTGKAAARLAEATARARTTLDCPDEIRALIPDTAQTLHRALGASRPGRSFRVDRERQLYADVVVVDEASMVDVTMMRRLVDAVPSTTRLILLGDHRQLSSVEAGAVLADICGDAAPRYSAELAARLKTSLGVTVPETAVGKSPPGPADSIVALTRSYRFGKDTPLGALAEAVERGDGDAVIGVLTAGGNGLELLSPRNERTPHPDLGARLVRGFHSFAKTVTAADALAQAESFRVLSAHRAGPLGVVDLNEMIERLLGQRGELGHFPGPIRPVMVTKNDASVGLFNGDVGVSFKESPDAPVRTHFTKPGALGARALSLARLPSHEPAFAISVHKSQGSEFDEIVVVLPPVGSPLLVRELLYTAVTRAKSRLTVHASVDSIRAAVERRMVRASGLSDALRA